MLPCVNMATFWHTTEILQKESVLLLFLEFVVTVCFQTLNFFFFKVTYPLDLLNDINIILYYSINTGCRYLSLVKDILEMPLLHYITSEYK